MSSNSIALEISSRSWSSSEPSSCASSTIERSSSSVILSSPLDSVTSRRMNFRLEKRKVMGKRTYEIALMGYPKAKATRSEFSFAIIFGVISPKMRTITVETATETAPLSDGLGIAFSKMLLNRTERVMFTMLLPTRIVERSLSKFSDSASAFLAALLPSCALSLSFVRFRELNAVSSRGKESGKCHQYYYENY